MVHGVTDRNVFNFGSIYILYIEGPVGRSTYRVVQRYSRFGPLIYLKAKYILSHHDKPSSLKQATRLCIDITGCSEITPLNISAATGISLSNFT